jgi:hypothetical protein
VGNLYKAHNQWASRPEDERFQSLSALATAVANRKDTSMEVEVPLEDFGKVRCAVDEKGVLTFGGHYMTPWSASQVASKVGAPYAYLSRLTPDLAAANLNEGLARFASAEENHRDVKLLMQPGSESDPGSVLRAVTSQGYARIWDREVVSVVQEWSEGFTLPLAYANGKWGAEKVPTGLYASDRDMFAFMVNDTDRIDLGGGETLGRGFMVWNSEVGKTSFGWMSFLFDYVCGNHIVWGAKEVRSFKVRHVGKARKALQTFPTMIQKLRNRGGQMAEQEKIREAITLEFGAKRDDELVEAVQKHATSRRVKLTNTEIHNALDKAEEEADTHVGSPFSLWGIVGGLTATAREYGHIDKRLDLEVRAGKLLPSLN